jgi:preprotein translocase subunit SecG
MANLTSWTEGILLTLAALTCILIIFGVMDIQYGQNYSNCLSGGCGQPGLSDNSGATNAFINNASNLQQQTQNGTVGFDSNGISLSTTYTIVQTGVGIIWSFLSGGFLENLINAMNLGAAGTAIATALRIIWFLGIVFFILYLLFKVKS